MKPATKGFGLACLHGVLMISTGWGHVRTGPEGFSINLPVSYERLAEVTHEVCGDGIVHGTFQYEHEKGIAGADTATGSAAFPPWTGSGDLCYKVRAQAIAPAHFVASNDVGTITVRYLVERVDDLHTHIAIDAVFVEDGHRRRHLSKGLVETSEFREIATRLKAIADAEAQAEEARQRREEQRLQAERAARKGQLQATLTALKSRLDTASARVEEDEKQVQELRRQSLARVRAPSAELKASPCVQATSLHLLDAGQTIRLLRRTAYWSQVRTKDGQEGWVYHLLLEPEP
jgi:hypothetical protein